MRWVVLVTVEGVSRYQMAAWEVGEAGGACRLSEDLLSFDEHLLQRDASVSPWHRLGGGVGKLNREANVRSCLHCLTVLETDADVSGGGGEEWASGWEPLDRDVIREACQRDGLRSALDSLSVRPEGGGHSAAGGMEAVFQWVHLRPENGWDAGLLRSVLQWFGGLDADCALLTALTGDGSERGAGTSESNIEHAADSEAGVGSGRLDPVADVEFDFGFPEARVRVPMLIRGKGIAGGRYPEATGSLDVWPTLSAALEMSDPGELQEAVEAGGEVTIETELPQGPRSLPLAERTVARSIPLEGWGLRALRLPDFLAVLSTGESDTPFAASLGAGGAANAERFSLYARPEDRFAVNDLSRTNVELSEKLAARLRSAPPLHSQRECNDL